MADEVSKLVVQVTSDSVETGTKRLDVFIHKAEQAEKATDVLTKGVEVLKDVFLEILAPLLAVESVFKAFDKLVEVTEHTEVLQAKLKTTVGSATGAKEALQALSDVAAETPFNIDDTTSAFIKLTQNGLDPSKKALMAYANIASGTEGTLLGIAETVTEAANGQYRALNQLGIKAINEIDGVTLIFRGNATKIKGDAQSIQDYIQKIGQTDFAGATEERAKTMEGTISDLSTAWGKLWNTISSLGVGDLIKDGFEVATEALTQLTDFLGSGQAKAYVEALGIAFEDFTKAASDDIEFLRKYVDSELKDMGDNGSDVLTFLKHAFTQFPENVAAVAKAIGATDAVILFGVETVATGIVDTFTRAFNLVVELSTNTGKALVENLNPFSKAHVSISDYLSQQTSALKSFGNDEEAIFKRSKEALTGLGEAWQDEISDVLDERDKTIGAFNAKIASANQLRAAYEAAKKARKESEADPLAKFQKPRGNDNTDEAQRKAFEDLKKSLQLQEITIEESYQKQKAIIIRNTKEGTSEQLDLLKKLNSNVELELDKASDTHEANVIALQQKLHDALTTGQASQVDTITLALQKEEEALDQSYQYRRKIILDNTKITEEQRNALLAQLDKKAIQQQREIEIAKNKQALDTTADFFGNISKIAGAFGEKGAKISKAAAIVQATIKTYESATSAYASLAGIPYIGPALGAAAAGAAIAAGLANVAAIKSQNYSGAYATGGFIPAGQFGLVGETGVPELVAGPTAVTSARASQDRNFGQTNTTNQKAVTVNVNNYTDVSATVTEKNTADGKTIDVIIKRVKSELSQDVRTGGNSLSKALESTYTLNRGRQ